MCTNLSSIILCEKVSKVHSYLFKDIMSVFILLKISKLIDPNLLIEIEGITIRED